MTLCCCPRCLTPELRQTAVLLAVGADHKDISQLMNCGYSTVVGRVIRLRTLAGANTAIEAIVALLDAGAITHQEVRDAREKMVL